MNSSEFGRIRSNTTLDVKRPALKPPSQLKRPTQLSPRKIETSDSNKLVTQIDASKKELKCPMTTKNSKISGVSKPTQFFEHKSKDNAKQIRKVGTINQLKGKINYKTASPGLNKTTIIDEDHKRLIPTPLGHHINKEKKLVKYIRNSVQINGENSGKQAKSISKVGGNINNQIRSTQTLRTPLQNNLKVSSRKIGIRKTEGNIEDIQSPPKTHQKKNSDIHYTSHSNK